MSASIGGILAIVSQIVQAAGTGVQVAVVAKRAHDALGIMVEEDRDPTQPELDTLFDRIDDRSDRIQGA